MKQHIINCFQQLGLDPTKRTDEIIDMEDYALEDSDNIYVWKNQSLEQAIHITLNEYFECHIEFLQLLTQHITESPKRILDLGCDDGALTCGLAMLFPDADVVGIDILPESISVARALAQKLKNPPRFEVLDLTQKRYSLGSFDVIVAKNIFYEIVELQHTPSFWHVAEMVESFSSFPDPPSYLRGIAELLSSNGLFFSTERISNAYTLGQWAHFLQKSGLTLELSKTSTLSYMLRGEQDKLPLFVCTKGHGQKPSVQDSFLLGHLYDHGMYVPYNNIVVQLIKKLKGGALLLHNEVHILMLTLERTRLLFGRIINNLFYTQDISIEEILSTEYGCLYLQLRASLQGATLRLLKESADDFIERIRQEEDEHYEIIHYNSIEEWEEYRQELY